MQNDLDDFKIPAVVFHSIFITAQEELFDLYCRQLLKMKARLRGVLYFLHIALGVCSSLSAIFYFAK